MTTGQMIKKIRTEKGITQLELANRLGISYVGVSQWETDKRNPKRETLNKIAKALDVPVSVLCGPPSFALEYSELSKMWDRASNQAKLARETGDEREIERWERVASELLKLRDEARDFHNALPNDNARLLDMFNSLNAKGKTRILEWIEDFCKIPEYQRSAPQQESPQKEEIIREDQ